MGVLEAPRVPAWVGGGVTIALGSGVSEQETGAFSSAVCGCSGPEIWVPSAQMHMEMQEINLMIYKEVQTGCWLFLSAHFPDGWEALKNRDLCLENFAKLSL